MKYICAERLISYLENEADKEFKKTEENANSPVLYHFHNGCRMQALDTIDFIKFLQQEQPGLPGIEENGIHGKDFIPVEWVDACKKYGKWEIVRQEQPEVDLEKASRNVYESWMGGTMDDVRRDMVELGNVLNTRKEE